MKWPTFQINVPFIFRHFYQNLPNIQRNPSIYQQMPTIFQNYRPPFPNKNLTIINSNFQSFHQKLSVAYLLGSLLFGELVDGLLMISLGLAKAVNSAFQGIISGLTNVLVFCHGRLKKSNKNQCQIQD